ncbi:MAG: alpha-glucuronidase [Bacteroidia bacterium]|nr:alpha-glucuronidase [Bacteroidia bacterium]
MLSISVKNLLLISCLFFFAVLPFSSKADDGYRLWLKYDKIDNIPYFNSCRSAIRILNVAGHSAVLDAARNELQRGLTGLFSAAIPSGNKNTFTAGLLLAGTPATIPELKSSSFQSDLLKLGEDGFIIREIKINAQSCIIIASNQDVGVLYGVFHFLRLLQTQTPLIGINISSSPRLQWRMLNHWDNIDASVERGYAGASIWKWDQLPGKIDPRYTDYARANASIGINGVVLNNVNASPEFLTRKYLEKAAVLAKVFRPYGIRVFLSANFASPKSSGNLQTADPFDDKVKEWWKNKADEIYKLIPDFGGFLVKANSEGQPGPQDYNRSHADGANMMADALSPHKGILIWRAFVYNTKNGKDRAQAAYDEFIQFDGSFRSNVLLQTKNGPLDFQPREPFSPLFGAMPKTSQMMEVQIKQEYLGRNTHLVYLAPLFKETLETDTYAKGKGSTVAKVIDGTLQGQPLTGIAGVPNIGDERNWTHHPFAQANWYAFGRLAWDHELTAKQIATEWINMTVTHDPSAIKTILNMMMGSRELLVSYETPLGLNVLCDGKHFGPQPWIRSYYHHADSLGIGFDRTSKGTNAVKQYFPAVNNIFEDIKTCPENLLAWFHHVPWNYKMLSGRSFWEELCYKYNYGVTGVRKMQTDWTFLKDKVDLETFDKVNQLLITQEDEAVWWRDACLWYFGNFARQPIPDQYEKPRYNQEGINKKSNRIPTLLN